MMITWSLSSHYRVRLQPWLLLVFMKCQEFLKKKSLPTLQQINRIMWARKFFRNHTKMAICVRECNFWKLKDQYEHFVDLPDKIITTKDLTLNSVHDVYPLIRPLEFKTQQPNQLWALEMEPSCTLRGPLPKSKTKHMVVSLNQVNDIATVTCKLKGCRIWQHMTLYATSVEDPSNRQERSNLSNEQLDAQVKNRKWDSFGPRNIHICRTTKLRICNSSVHWKSDWTKMKIWKSDSIGFGDFFHLKCHLTWIERSRKKPSVVTTSVSCEAFK